MKYILLIPLLVLSTTLSAENIKGVVFEKNEDGVREPLVGANVYWAGTTHGTISDVDGKFELSRHNEDVKLVVSFVGYVSETVDTKGLKFIEVELVSGNQLADVVVKSSTTFLDHINPIKTEVISSKELLKAACCNLSESFDTNASVDVSFTDAVSGAKKIQLLGLDGTYTQIMTENLPAIRGLANNYGLSFIPGTWVSSIDVGKGAGSVINGYESMTGQINVELIKPEQALPPLLNIYVNSIGRLEGNFVASKKISKKWSTGLMLHASDLSNSVDGNNDGFKDTPLYTQINGISRFKYDGDRYKAQFGIKVLNESRTGGATEFRGSGPVAGIYGTGIETQRVEIFAKNGLLFPETPYRGLGLVTSATFHNQQAFFGNNIYEGKQNTVYANLIYQSIINNTNHQLRTGISYMFDSYDESLNDSTFQREESVPGVFTEYTFSGVQNLTIVAGLRADYHSIYDMIYTPRLHIKYDFLAGAVLRASAGRGFRTPNFIGENLSLLASSRMVAVKEVLLPEESWNFGLSLNKEYFIKERSFAVDLEFFRTQFSNELIIDRDSDPSLLLFYNLNGDSYANSFKAEIAYEANDYLDLKAAYKYYDVKSTIGDKLRQVAFQSKDRVFVNAGYSTEFDIWKFDITGNWFGKKRLPILDGDTPGIVKNSDDFVTINAQITKAFRKWDWYIGVENLNNYIQETPIIGSDDPFGARFDATMVWGPVVGRMIYSGMRYTFK